jgi:hypothetical protein
MENLNIGKNVIQGKTYLVRSTEPFDWYQIYSGVKDVITQYINKNDRILNVGCGNSRKNILYRNE